MSVELAAVNFRKCLNQSFRLSIGEDSLDVQLIQVNDVNSDTHREDKAPFSILFRGPKELTFDQQIVQIQNDQMGEHHIFLVPIGPDPDHEERGMLFEAVFT